MQGIVNSVTQSKTGKSWRIKVGNEFYGAKFDTKLDAALGKMIDFEISDDVKYGKWITSWAYIGSTATAPAPEPAITREPLPQVAPRALPDRWWMNFMSNCVGQAIAAKTITEPNQIQAWALAARRAALHADDDIPF